jgi:hypothetical protein
MAVSGKRHTPATLRSPVPMDGDWVDLRPGQEVLGERRNSCPCRDSNPRDNRSLTKSQQLRIKIC